MNNIAGENEAKGQLLMSQVGGEQGCRDAESRDTTLRVGISQCLLEPALEEPLNVRS